jgi:hypothetical protein
MEWPQFPNGSSTLVVWLSVLDPGNPAFPVQGSLSSNLFLEQAVRRAIASAGLRRGFARSVLSLPIFRHNVVRPERERER